MDTVPEHNTMRGHELYLRHLLLLGQAAPILLRAIVEKTVITRKGNLQDMLLGIKLTMQMLFMEEYIQLFSDDVVNTDLQSWDTRLLCIVIGLLFTQDLSETELQAVRCIMKQRNELDNYASSALLDFNTYETKWKALHQALLKVLDSTDSDSKFKCTRSIQSFAKEPIQVNMELIQKMKEHKSVTEHLKVAIHYLTSDILNTECNEKALSTQFSTKLQNTDVYENEKVILHCETDSEKMLCEWFKYSDRLELTDNINFFRDGCRHYLEISAVGIEDSGIYTCRSGETFTSAFVNVKEKPVKFLEPLTDTEVPEGEDITLTCRVNVLRKAPLWFYNGKELDVSSVRRKFSTHGLDLKLTILNAKLYDDGSYTCAFGEVSTIATLTVTDNIGTNSYKKQLAKQNFRNWVRGALALFYVKQGLVDFTNKCVKKQHKMIINSVSAPVVKCKQCSLETLMPFQGHANNKLCSQRQCLCWKKTKAKTKPPPKRSVCPNGGFCSMLYDEIRDQHRFSNPCLENTDVSVWSSDPWSIGTCFVNTPGCTNRKSAEEIDCSGLLSIFINNEFFNTELGDAKIDGQTDPFKRATDARNEIFHNANYDLSQSELKQHIALFKDMLEIRNVANQKPLTNEPQAVEAMKNLDRLETRQLFIDEEVTVMAREMKYEEITDKLEKANEEMKAKTNEFTEKMKEKEEEIKMLRQVRQSEQVKKMMMIEVVFSMKITITGSSNEKLKKYNDKILAMFGRLVNRHELQATDQQEASSLLGVDEEMEKLVRSLVEIPCLEVSQADDETFPHLKIKVTSNEGLDGFLSFMNGRSLQKKLFQLRKSIEKEIGESVVVDASITRDSFNDAMKQLSALGISDKSRTNFECSSHSWMQNAWYCIEHREFCCSLCKSKEHRFCQGVQKVISELTNKKCAGSLLSVKEVKSYNVRKRSIRNSETDCEITGMCVLPGHGILLVDNANERLKKLDRSYKIVSYCDIPPGFLRDVCYIGNNTAVVSAGIYSLYFVDVSGNMKLKQNVATNVYFDRMVCHGDTIHGLCDGSVFTFKTVGKSEPYISDTSFFVCDIAVSDDGERIYTVSMDRGLETTDNEGNLLSTNEIMGRLVCTGGNGTVLVYDSIEDCIVHVNYDGTTVLGWFEPKVGTLNDARFLCYERHHHQLVVAHGDDKVTVIEIEGV